MKSKTKNTVNIEIIKQITAKHFPKFNIGEVRELSGGMFNAAYLITGNNDNGDNNMVLKVGPITRNAGTDLRKRYTAHRGRVI